MGHIVTPYVQDLGESIKCTCTKYCIQTFFRGYTTLKQMLVRPKDQDPNKKKSKVICSYQCGTIDCGEENISETSRTQGERYKDHLREPSPIQAHSQLIGHQLSQDNFSIIGREDQDLTRLIKESIYIRVNNPTLKRNMVKFQLNHIWDRILFSTPKIKVAVPTRNVQHSPLQLYKSQHLQLPLDLMKSRVLAKACLCSTKVLFGELFYCIMPYQKNEKSTQRNK